MEEKDIMIEQHLKGRDIHDENVLIAMHTIDRELFVADDIKDLAYDDTALPIGGGQTISQPYIVAYMAQALDLHPHYKVLEIGTGCGYNAAILSRLVAQVYSIEIIDWLADMARKNLKVSDISNVRVRTGDGFQGWEEEAPFDRIVLTASTPHIPAPLKAQLKTGGKILAPVKNTFQKLVLLDKKSNSLFQEHPLIPVRFVPMSGEKSEPNRWKKGYPKEDWLMD